MSTATVSPTTIRMEMIPPDNLRVDHRTQRPHMEAHSKKMAEKWDPNLCGVLVVSRRADGGLYIIDGQHRHHAAIKAGQGHVPVACYVIDGLTIEEEAKQFVGINSTARRPSKLAEFEVRLTANDPSALAINEIVHDAGLQITSALEDGHVAAVVALEWVYDGKASPRRKGTENAKRPELLIATLHALYQAYGLDRHAYDGTIIKAMAMVLHRHARRIEPDRLAERLATAGTARQLLGRARTLADAGRIPVLDATYNAIIGHYNQNLRTGKRRIEE